MTIELKFEHKNNNNTWTYKLWMMMKSVKGLDEVRQISGSELFLNEILMF